MKNKIFVLMLGRITTWKQDFLEWYNNLDVLPFIEAVRKMRTTKEDTKEDISRSSDNKKGVCSQPLLLNPLS